MKMNKFSTLLLTIFLLTSPTITAEIEAVKTAMTPEVKEGLPEGNITKGKKIFGKCRACHTTKKGGQNRVGPNLWGIVGKGIAEDLKFKYSKAYQSKKGQLIWDEHVLFDYLEAPRTYIKGTRMVFNGLKRRQDRLDLITFLKTLKDDKK